MAFVQVEIEPEAITDAMLSDPNFAAEMWCELANKLNMGRLRDDACDLFSTAHSDDARILAHELGLLAKLIADRQDMALDQIATHSPQSKEFALKQAHLLMRRGVREGWVDLTFEDGLRETFEAIDETIQTKG